MSCTIRDRTTSKATPLVSVASPPATRRPTRRVSMPASRAARLFLLQVVQDLDEARHPLLYLGALAPEQLQLLVQRLQLLVRVRGCAMLLLEGVDALLDVGGMALALVEAMLQVGVLLAKPLHDLHGLAHLLFQPIEALHVLLPADLHPVRLQRPNGALDRGLNFFAREGALGLLVAECEQHADLSLRHLLALVAVSEVDGSQQQARTLSGPAHEVLRRDRTIDDHREIARGARMPWQGLLADIRDLRVQQRIQAQLGHHGLVTQLVTRGGVGMQCADVPDGTPTGEHSPALPRMEPGGDRALSHRERPAQARAEELHEALRVEEVDTPRRLPPLA